MVCRNGNWKNKISNFKRYYGSHTINFNKKYNVIIGNNELGKSTIFMALDLVLSGSRNKIVCYLINYFILFIRWSVMNKYKITLLILFLIILFSVNQVNAYVNDFPLLGKTIYLDAGH